MEEPNLEPVIKPQTQTQTPQILSPSSSGRRSNNPNSPEFEFWRNPSLPQLNLHSADELFVDGIILPLCLLSHHHSDEFNNPSHDESNPQQNLVKKPISDVTVTEPELQEPVSEPGPGPESSSSSSTGFSSSKRWRDIFKVGDKKSSTSNQEGGGDKEKKKDRKSSSGGTNNSAELNINIWPFSRSRSAGNNVNRPKMTATRKVSSAPCSRSNSGGESKSKKQWPNSPSRGGGIHLGRSSPVWQVKRGGGTNTALKTSENGVKNADKAMKKDGSSVDSRWSKSRLGGGGGGGSGVGVGLNLNVQMCMGYRQNSSCRNDENNSSSSSSLVGGEQSCSGGAAGTGGNGVKLFNRLNTLFSKKVY